MAEIIHKIAVSPFCHPIWQEWPGKIKQHLFAFPTFSQNPTLL
jgi:hypothetical protein